MARPLWSGSVSFGLVNIPVRMFSAEHDHDIGFHQINKKTGHRIRYKKVDASSGREVAADDLVRGFEVHEGTYVTFTDEELEELRPATTRTIDIQDFVDLAEIDPVYFDRTYYLAPGDDVGAKRGYRLLHDAMTKAEQAGIGTVVMHNKQYLAAIRPFGKILAVSMMRFHDEVVDPGSIDDLHLDPVQVDAKAAKMAAALIHSLSGPFEPEKYHDTYTEQLRDTIERKAKGETIEVEEPAPKAEVIDLMAALQASLDAGRSGRSGSARAGSTRGAAAQGSAKAKTTGKARPASAKGEGGTRSKGPTTKGTATKRAATKRPATATSGKRSSTSAGKRTKRAPTAA